MVKHLMIKAQLSLGQRSLIHFLKNLPYHILRVMDNYQTVFLLMITKVFTAQFQFKIHCS